MQWPSMHSCSHKNTNPLGWHHCWSWLMLHSTTYIQLGALSFVYSGEAHENGPGWIDLQRWWILFHVYPWCNIHSRLDFEDLGGVFFFPCKGANNCHIMPRGLRNLVVFCSFTIWFFFCLAMLLWHREQWFFDSADTIGYLSQQRFPVACTVRAGMTASPACSVLIPFSGLVFGPHE